MSQEQQRNRWCLITIDPATEEKLTRWYPTQPIRNLAGLDFLVLGFVVNFPDKSVKPSDEDTPQEHTARVRLNRDGIDDKHPYHSCPFCRQVWERFMRRDKADLVAELKKTLAYSAAPPERWRKDEVAWSLVYREVQP